MATRQQLVERCRELGVSLKFDESSSQDQYGVIIIDAPSGFVFRGSQLHYYDLYLNPSWKRSEAYDAIMEELSMGLDKCDVHNCEICNSK